MTIFIIDPGHGGTDPGAVSNGLQEKDLTLDISKRIANILKAHGIDARLTRDSDKTMSLSDRTKCANQQGAAGLVSVHINSAASSDANGLETYVYTTDGADSKSVKLQSDIHSSLSKLWTSHGRKDRGKKKANLHMVREFKGAAVLVELGFIVNKIDAGLLALDDFKQSNAEAVAGGILAYLGKPELIPEPPKTTNPVAPNDTLLRVTVEGKQVGAYSNADNAINQASTAIKSGKKSVTIKRGN